MKKVSNSNQTNVSVNLTPEEIAAAFNSNTISKSQRTIKLTPTISLSEMVKRDREIINNSNLKNVCIKVFDDGVIRLPKTSLQMGLGKKLKELGVQSRIESF